MIEFEKFELDNGLRVIVHEDLGTPMAVVNILYDVGSRDEEESKTGFAHLFEHLMFGGSKNIPDFDKPLQKAGGSSNAFTSPDVTNYYITLPSQNLETAFWLESDRMHQLDFSQKSLDIQKKVVVEEFKQRYLNQPYGDVWLKLRPLVYKIHPYKWPTIGKDISHIEEAQLSDVEHFFYKFYRPSNAILVVAGGVNTHKVRQLAEKWFGPITSGKRHKRKLPKEGKINADSSLEVSAKVPASMLYKVWQMCGKSDSDYYATDLLSDMLGRGKSSILHQQLVKKNNLFDTISAFISGSRDPGMFVVSGRIAQGASAGEAIEGVNSVINHFLDSSEVHENLYKVKSQALFSIKIAETELLNRAINLAYAELEGGAELINQESNEIKKISEERVRGVFKEIFLESGSSTLLYFPEK